MTKEMSRGIGLADSDAFFQRHSSQGMRPYSTFRAGLGELETSVASIKSAPPGYYEDPPYNGISVCMMNSRAVGKIDAGEGAIDMNVQADDFILGIPGSINKMETNRGGHWVQILVSPKALNSRAEHRFGAVWDFGRLHTTFHSDTVVRNLIMQIAAEGVDSDQPDEAHVDSLVLSLLDTLRRFSAACYRRERETPALDHETVAQITEFIDANLPENISLDALAQISGFPRTRFLKAFRNAVGETPYKHLVRRRLEAARLLLMTQEISIADIAFECGFSSQQHLTGLFTKRFGISPAGFRKQVISREIVELRCTELA